MIFHENLFILCYRTGVGGSDEANIRWEVRGQVGAQLCEETTNIRWEDKYQISDERTNNKYERVNYLLQKPNSTWNDKYQKSDERMHTHVKNQIPEGRETPNTKWEGETLNTRRESKTEK